MRICIRMLLFTVSLRLCAQPACPTLNFLNAQTVNLKPSPTSHVDAVRQFDGSYTAFEVADAPPHRIITKMPHFERQFGACVPHVVPSSPVPAPPPVANPLGAGSQAQVVSMLPSGNYMVAGINGAAWSDPIPSIIYFDVFDSELQLISENAVAAPNAGESFVGLAFADLNRDGKLDVVALSEVHTGHGFAFPAIWSFLGNGDGTFQAGKRQAVAGSLLYGAISFTVGDLNNDQKPDFILGSLGPDSVVALGNGDGTFSQVQPWSAYSTTGGVALGDLNGDGRLDRVVVDLNAGLVYVALGNGDGSFQPFQSYPCLTIPFKAAITASAEVAIGDVNGDSIPDIVTASGTILFGDGKGAFPNRRDYLVGGNESVMLADFDGDGKVDILIGAGNPDFISGSPDHPTLTVLFGRGGGAFVAAPVTWGSTESMVTADFDGDGIPDLAVTSGRVLSILKGRGNGDFSSVFRYDLPGAPAMPVVADLNHDGMPDLVMLVSTSAGTPPELLLFFGRGDGTLASPLTVPVPDNSASFLAAADLNGDNLPDLVVTGQSSVWVWIARGGGLFASPLAYPVEGTGLPSLAIGDFNGDGKPDMAVAVQSPGGIALLLGKGDGTFAPGTTIPVSVPSTGSDPVLVGPLQLAAADLNGDGRLDLAATFGNYGGSSTGSAIALLLGKGDGTFQSPATVTEPAVQIAAADLNGDGIPDLVVAWGGITPGTAVLVGNGDGTFQPEARLTPVFLSNIVISDFNVDGRPDIAGSVSAGVAVLLNLSQPPAALSVVSAASFATGPLAPNSIAAAFGRNLSTGTAAAGSIVLPASLAGTTVTVRDSGGVNRSAPLFYASPGQINFLVPPGTALGPAVITVAPADGISATAQTTIVPFAPALFSTGAANIAAAYVVRVAPDGTQTIEPVFTDHSGSIQSVPIDVRAPGQVYLTLFGTGFDTATVSSATVNVQGVNAPVSYAGPHPVWPGLDQANVLLPSSLAGSGIAAVTLSVNGTQAKPVYVAIR